MVIHSYLSVIIVNMESQVSLFYAHLKKTIGLVTDQVAVIYTMRLVLILKLSTKYETEVL